MRGKEGRSSRQRNPPRLAQEERVSFDPTIHEITKEVTRTRRFCLLIATTVLVSLSGIIANAQSRSHQQVRVSVPFTFSVGNASLPAGDYVVSVVNPTSDRSVLQFTSRDGKSTTMISTTDVEGWATSKAKLTFRHYGNQYFLAQVWMASESTGFATPHSSSERTLRQQLGRAAKKVETVAVNAN